MITLIVYALLFILAVNGLLMLGIRHQRKQQERVYQDAVRQLKVVSISRGRRN